MAASQFTMTTTIIARKY